MDEDFLEEEEVNDNPSMFTQKPGSVRRGMGETAVTNNVSPQSGFAAKTAPPVWRMFVDNVAFQKTNAQAIAAERSAVSQSNAMMARQAEKNDPNKLGFERDLDETQNEISRISLSRQDPNFKRLDKKEREIFEAERGMKETSAQRKKELDAILGKEQQLDEEDQRLYQLKVKANELKIGGVPYWQQTYAQQQKTIADQANEVAGRSQSRLQEIETADSSAAQEETALMQKLKQGVRGTELSDTQAKLAEIKQAREALAEMKAAPDKEVEQVKAQAQQSLDGERRQREAQIREKLFTTNAVDASGVKRSLGEKIMGGLNDLGSKINFDFSGDVVKDSDIQKFTNSLIAEQGGREKAREYLSSGKANGKIANDFISQSLSYLQKQDAEFEAAGITDSQERERLFIDAVKEREWTTKDTDNVRALSTGEVAINPARIFGRREEIAADIQAKAGSEADAQAAIERMDAMRQGLAEKANYTLSVTDEDYNKHVADMKKAGVSDTVKIVDAYVSQMRDRNGFIKFGDAMITAVNTGGYGIYKTAVGGTAGIAAAVGADKLAGTIGAHGERVGKGIQEETEAAEMRGLTGGYKISQDLVSTVVQMAPMLIGGAQAQTMKGLGQAVVGGMSVYGWAGAQGYESKLSDAINMEKQKLGRDLNQQEIAETLGRGDVQLSAFANGAQTAILAKLLGGGAERAAIGKAAQSMTVKDFLTKGGRRALQDSTLRAELGKMAKTIFADAGDEFVEEGLNQFLDKAISSVGLGEDFKLGDALVEAFQAGAMGSVVGGALPQFRRGGQASMEAQESDAINTRLVAQDPSSTKVSQEEIDKARQYATSPNNLDDVAKNVTIIRQIEGKAATAKESLTQAQDQYAQAQVSGDPVALAQAEQTLRKATAEAAAPDQTTGMLKINSGKPLETLTDAEIKALGITRTGKPASTKELAEAGLTSPLVSFDTADGSPVITDAGIAVMGNVSPAARAEVKMNETQYRAQALAKAQEAAAAAQTGAGANTGANGTSAPTGSTPGSSPAPAAATGNPTGMPVFRVTGTNGTVIEVPARNESDAQVQALSDPAWQAGETVDSVFDLTEETAEPQVGAPEVIDPANNPPEGTAAPAAAPQETSKALTRVRKTLAKAKKMLGDDLKITTDPKKPAAVAYENGTVEINLDLLRAKAAERNMTEDEASIWISKTIDEEVRHAAQHRAARAIWKSKGSLGDYETWRDEHYGRIWQDEFVATGKADMVMKLYGKKLQSSEDWQKAFEGLRMIQQKAATGSPTEVAKLWANLGADVVEHIRAALKALKEFVSSGLSPDLQVEIDAITAQLAEYDKANKPAKPAPAPKAPEITPKASQAAEAQSAEPGPEAQEAQPQEQKQPSRVTFVRNGETFTGPVRIQSQKNGKIIVEVNGKNVLVDPSEVVEQPKGQDQAPKAQKTQETQGEETDKKSDKEWESFGSESLGIPRAEMPQIKAEDRSAMVQFLRARGIDYTADVMMRPSQISPTQAEYSPDKVAKAKAYEGGDRAILISANGRIVDGHHQWLAALEKDPDQPIKVIVLNAPIMEILETVKEMPSAETAEGATAPEPTQESSTQVPQAVEQTVEQQPVPAFNQAEYAKRKRALNKAIKAKDWPTVLAKATADLEYFEKTVYPDDWSMWERAKEDAENAISPRNYFGSQMPRPLVEPKAAEQPAPAAKPKLTEGEQSLKDAFSGLVEGLENSELTDEYYQQPIPAEKIGQFIGAAQKLIAEGVNTPAGLATALDKISPRLRVYSKAVWGAFVMVNPSLKSEVKWPVVYSEIDKGTPLSSQEKTEDKESVMADVAEAARVLAFKREKFTKADVAGADPNKVLSKKELDEAIETGITAAAHQIAQNSTDDAQTYQRLVKLYDSQPSLTAKTSTSKINQAYSTPAPMAFVAGRLLNIDAGNDVLMEPTFGHGMLIMDVPASTEVYANELDPDRISRTIASIPNADTWKISNEDGTKWTPAKKATKIISNPPFGSLMDDSGENIKFETPAGVTTAIDHAIMLQALENMTENGRAVFIIGGPAKTLTSDEARKGHYARGAKGDFFKYLHDNYGVIDHFTVNGSLYSKQGAGWNIDIITIQGKKPSRTALPSAKAPRMVNTWDELFETTTLSDEERIQLNRISEADVRQQVGNMADALAGIGKLGGKDAPGKRAGETRDEDGRSGDGDATVTQPDQSQSGVGQVDVGMVSESDVDSGNRPTDAQPGRDTDGETRPVDQPPVRKSNADRAAGRSAVVKESGKFQAEYTPFSGEKGLDTLLPRNMVQPVTDAFARIKEDLGDDLTGFVRDQLGYPKGTDITKYLAGEQIDAVAAAIWNFQNGGALIIGDQTGIGKGRIAAALMKYAVNQGFVPVFMTKDPGLHDAMLTEDLPDIDGKEIVPAVMDTKLQFDSGKKNKLNHGEEYFAAIRDGKLPGDSNAIFVTYSQLTADDAKGLTKEERAAARNAGEAPRDKWRMAALRSIAPNAVFILDESHLASGQSTTGWRVADILRRASRVYYSSATSVKRPDNMGIYFKTNVGKITGGNMAELTDLMNAGGVPAMQVVSSMLAQDGQYLRRERSFDGVKFETQISTETSARDIVLADNLTGALREIVVVQDAMQQAAEAINGVIAQVGKRMNIPPANRAKLETANFSSKLHNIVSQYLLAIKTKATADTAIREIKAGKKVVVSVQSTMESAIDALEFGGFEMSYKGLVLRYLDQMRFLESGKKAFGRGEVEKFEIKEKGAEEFEGLTDRELAQKVVSVSTNADGDQIAVVNDDVAAELMRRAMWDVFARSIEAIEATDFGNLPLSPIDAMRQAVESAGIRTGEITGRKRGIDENGEIYSRSAQDTSKPARRVAQAAFNNEDLDFLVINQSGSTGISLHASQKAANKATRVMIVAQPNLDINEFMQTLGRIHRSGQVVKPEFILLQTDLPAEKRPAAILGRKMAMLNANTTSNAKTDVSEGNTAIDIFNQYGDEIVYQVLERDPDIQSQLRPLGSSLAKFFEGDKLIAFQDAQKLVAEQPDGYIARTITGYLAILPVEEQQNFWEKTLADYEAYITYLDQIGQNALEAKAVDLKATTISREVFTEPLDGDSAFSAASYLERVETKVGKKPLTGEEAKAITQKARPESRKAMQDYIATADATMNELADKKSARALKAWTEEKRTDFISGQKAQRNVIANAISMLGRFGNVGRDDGTTGLGVIEEIRINEEYILTPSKQIAIIRVNDSRETIKVPVSQLTDAFTPAPFEDDKEWDDTTDVGGQAAIVTGNLMMGMKALGGSGKVVTYTTDDGAEKMGILLPKSFLARQEAMKARKPVNEHYDLIDALATGTVVANGDESIKWTKDGEQYRLTVPASRSKGGDVWRNPILNRNAIDGEFVQVGGEMRAKYTKANVKVAFDTLKGMDETFSTLPGKGAGLEAADIYDLPIEKNPVRLKMDGDKPRYSVLIQDSETQVLNPRFYDTKAEAEEARANDKKLIEQRRREVEKQVKDINAELFGEGLENADLSDEAPPFYSQLSRTIAEKMPKTSTPLQVLQIAKAGAKAEEIKWSGLIPWLQGKEKVFKDEVLKWLSEEGAVRFKEVVSQDRRQTRYSAVQHKDLPVNQRRYVGSDSASDTDWVLLDDGNPVYLIGEADSEEDALELMDQESIQAEGTSLMRETRYAQYTLPGGENYREVVLAMPVNIDVYERKIREMTEDQLSDEMWRVAALRPEKGLEREDHIQFILMHGGIGIKERSPLQYTSRHFPDVPNYVAHMRLNERADATGAKGLFIEEIQSDRHQEGRKKGYKSDEITARLEGDNYIVTTPTEEHQLNAMNFNNQQEAVDFIRRQTIADAPFRTTWHLALFKRALRDAVASGKSWIGWTTGETQNDRFDLSKSVEKITVSPYPDYDDKNSRRSISVLMRGKYHDLFVDDNAVVVGTGNNSELGQVVGKPLDEVLGKDMAQKIMAVPQDKYEGQTFAGVDLKVGGSGMKAFYDTMLPKEIGKYVKQWGGKVEKSGIPHPEFKGDLPIWRVDITPELRNAVDKGQPLFNSDLEDTLGEMGTEADREEIRKQQEAFKEEGKVVGRPDLANPGMSEATRNLFDEEDEIRKLYATRETRDQWNKAGLKLANENEEEVVKAWLAAALQADRAADAGGVEFDAQQLNPELVVAIRIIMERRAKQAGGDPAKLAKVSILRNAYRSARSNIARVMAAGVDVFKTPEQRHREQLVNLITQLPEKDMRQIEERFGSGTKEQQAAKEQEIEKQTLEQIKRIEKELAKMGVTIDEILNGEAFLSLSQNRIIRNITDKMDNASRLAVKLMQQGNGFDAIRRKTGLPDTKIEKIRADLYKKLEEKIRAKVEAGMTLEDMKDQMKGALEMAALSGLTPEQVQAEIDRIISVGFGIPKQLQKKSGIPAAKKVKSKIEDDEESLEAGANRVAKRWIDRLAVSQSDTLAWKKSGKEDELSKLIRAHLAKPVPGFAQKVQQYGVTAEQARVLDAEANTERGRKEMIRQWKKSNPKRKPKSLEPKKAYEVDWNRPEFSEGLEDYAFTTDERTDLMERVVELRMLTGINGTVESLTGKDRVKGDQLIAQMDAILAKYKTSALEMAQGKMKAADYRFDISDRRHVAIIARTIAAINASTIDKAQEYYYSSILSGLQTMIINASGAINSLYQATVDRAFESMLNSVINSKDNASLGEYKYLQKALRPGWARAWSNAVATWNTEIPFFEEDILNRPPDFQRIAEANSSYRPGSIAGMKGRIIRTPSRILMATDDFMNTLRASAEVGAMAFRLAKKRGMKPGSEEFNKFLQLEVNTPGSISWQMAADRALRGSFNTPLPGQPATVQQSKKKSENVVPVRTATDFIGFSLGKVQKALTPIPLENATAATLKTLTRMLFIPFIRVPFNIMQQGIERTINPLSILDISILLGSNLRVKDGKFTLNADGGKERLIEYASKQMQGAVLIAVLAALGEGDDDDLDKTILITGSRPYKDTKKGERELGYRMGLGPYVISIKMPGGKRLSFGYGRIEPFATMMGGTIDTLKAVKLRAAGKIGSGEMVGKALSGLTSQINEKTSLRGAADMLEILSGEGAIDKFAADRLSVIIPNFVKQGLRESDPLFREKPEGFKEMLIAAMFPTGAITGQPAKVDIYGREQEKPGKTAIGRIVDPTDTTIYGISEKTDTMLYNWIRQNPHAEIVAPSSAGKTYTDPITKEKAVPMTGGQYEKFVKVAGDRIKAMAKRTPFNIDNPTEEDIKRFREIVEDSRTLAKRVLVTQEAWRNLK